MPRRRLDSGWVLHTTRKFILAGELGAGCKQEEVGVGETREEGGHRKRTVNFYFHI